ncbi:glycoside hydrolase family 30 beta sandwich domain-containing protein [Geothrix sp. PMB-07]|uniref:glycoside hydrolase family 30 protein n=1 Tax=Geothrix sp. PMB-07 TaxID=3068640 RepID=UPI002740DB29|nr:glycoside hydrolase family 30 beta sandwich domain-containing protein [Geothrix sp. PMB-07]WLT30906.1 glycoside hydrolase family 30 beta sandwich domain-containing protein [Geothrix sp. PMB-07]
MIRLVFLPMLGLILAAQTPQPSLLVSTVIATWVEVAPPAMLPPQPSFQLEVTDIEEQTIRGWGGCFNELGWAAMEALPEGKRAEVLASLYGPTGLRFTLGRVPVGANDYSADWYSHDETKEDFELKHFSIQRDRLRLLPYLKSAKTLEPSLTLWASPWCPPSWMKTNNHYACKPSPQFNDLKPEGRGGEMRTQFRMEPPYLKCYAAYLARFVRAYEAEGLPIKALHVQNEFNSCQVFPSCVWEPKDLATFIGGYLGPRFEMEALPTEIWLGTVERPHFERIRTIIEDPATKHILRGVGFQWAGKDGIALVHRQYPKLPLVQTETECGEGANSWTDAEYTFRLIRHYLGHGAEAHMAWNMVLEKGGVSRWGWVQNALITIDKAAGTVTWNPEYHLFRHFSAFVLPGARRLATTGEDREVLAFRNADGGTVMVLGNTSDEARSLKARVKGRDLALVLPAHSFSTLVLPK